MKSFITAAALLAATVAANKRDLCADGSVDDNGNWYCQEVSAITYTGVGGSGSYDKVTNMWVNGGECFNTPQAYSGSMSPLDEELSIHFRGPIKLKQFAVYTPSSSSKSKRDTRRSAHARRHAHGHAHGHNEAREAQVMVTATINGVVESWVNDYTGVSTSAAAASPSSAAKASSSSAPKASSSSTPAAAPVVKVAASSSSSAAPAASSASSASGSISSSSGSWSRQAYYQSSSGTGEGLVFLNHEGGTGSGVFDYTFGNSLSFSSADGRSGVAQSTVLEDCTLASDTEVVIMSNNACSGDSCGYVRNKTVAYHGFEGATKAFFFEFQMPYTGETASSIYTPVDMPAIWLLNAQVPRTLQYGSGACSCWQSGCGEFDVFEVLAAGDSRMKSTLHGNVAGGDSDYFLRPENAPMWAAVIFYDNNIHIQVLPNNTVFGSSMDGETISEIISSTLTQTKTVSLFSLTGAASG